MFVAHFMRSKSSTGRGRTDQNSVGRSNIYINSLNNPTLHEDHSCLHGPRFCIIHEPLGRVARACYRLALAIQLKNVQLSVKSARKLPLRKPIFAAHSGAVENVLSVMYSLASPVYSTALKSVLLAEFRALSWSHHHGPRNHAGRTFCF
jgi:hypothetical protein